MEVPHLIPPIEQDEAKNMFFKYCFLNQLHTYIQLNTCLLVSTIFICKEGFNKRICIENNGCFFRFSSHSMWLNIKYFVLLHVPYIKTHAYTLWHSSCKTLLHSHTFPGSKMASVWKPSLSPPSIYFEFGSLSCVLSIFSTRRLVHTSHFDKHHSTSDDPARDTQISVVPFTEIVPLPDWFHLS